MNGAANANGSATPTNPNPSPAVYEAKICEDLYTGAPAPVAGAALPELEAWEEAKAKVRDKNLTCSEVARKMFVLYANLLSEMLSINGPPSWSPKSVQIIGRI